MTTNKVWSIELFLTEDPDTTRADAVLQIEDREFRGFGRARRNPADPDVPKIGEELATARALSDLSQRLLHAAAGAIEAFEGHKVNLSASPQPRWARATAPGEGGVRRRVWGGYFDEVGDSPGVALIGEPDAE